MSAQTWQGCRKLVWAAAALDLCSLQFTSNGTFKVLLISMQGGSCNSVLLQALLQCSQPEHMGPPQ